MRGEKTEFCFILSAFLLCSVPFERARSKHSMITVDYGTVTLKNHISQTAWVGDAKLCGNVVYDVPELVLKGEKYW